MRFLKSDSKYSLNVLKRVTDPCKSLKLLPHLSEPVKIKYLNRQSQKNSSQSKMPSEHESKQNSAFFPN